MQNLIPKYGHNSIILEKPGYLSKKPKALTSINYHRVGYFLLKFCTRFLLSDV